MPRPFARYTLALAALAALAVLAWSPLGASARQPAREASGPDPLLELQHAAVPSTVDVGFDRVELLSAGSVMEAAGWEAVGRRELLVSSTALGTTAFAFYDTSALADLAGPFTFESLFEQSRLAEHAEANHGCGAGAAFGRYDQLADRWVLVQGNAASGQLCVLVSRTEDPIAGGWFAYRFRAPSAGGVVALSVWPEVYLLASRNPSAPIVALDRQRLLAGEPAPLQLFAGPTPPGTLEVAASGALVAGTVLGQHSPALGTAALLVRPRDDERGAASARDASRDTLEVWQLHADLARPAESRLRGPVEIAIADFDSARCAAPPCATAADQLSGVLYRRYPGHEALVGSFTVRAGIRWFELRRLADRDWRLYQEGTYALDPGHQLQSSIALDGAGNIVVGYLASGAEGTVARYVGRLAGDPLGTLPQTDVVVSMNAAERRAHPLGLDPGDDCTFWYPAPANEETASVIARFRFSSCEEARQLPRQHDPRPNALAAPTPALIREARAPEARTSRSAEMSAGSLSTAVPGPTAAALAKYGDIPVSLYTGTPNIDLPLYELKGRKLSVPISLSYHASGVKVGEIPGWVGLGWSLNAGGVITRTVRGLPDDGLAGYHDTSAELDRVWETEPVPYEYLERVLGGGLDAEPDDFFYNFGGQSGRFVMGTDDIRTIPQSKLEFEFERDLETVVDRPVYGVTRWTVTDESGTRYVFEDIEWYYERDAGDCSLCGHAASWYLSKIVSADGLDEINFEYERAATPIVYPQQTYREEVRIRTGNCSGPTSIVRENTNYNLPVWLRRIEAAQGSVELESSAGREDLALERKLDRLLVRSGNDGTAKRFEFGYGYFGNNGVYRLRLDRVTEQSSDGAASLPPYVFQYDQSHLPDRLSFAVDHWGYYNGQERNSTSLPAMTIVNPFNNTIEFYDGADREPYPAFLQAGMLTAITYPTGGSTRFEYEAHRYGSIGTMPLIGQPGPMQGQFVSRYADQGFGETVAEFTVGGTSDALVFVEARFAIPNGDQQICTFGHCLEVRIRNAGGELVYQAAGTGTGTHSGSVRLAPGTYQLAAATLGFEYECIGCSMEAKAVWQDIGGGPGERVAGGLRIRQITDHDGLSGDRDRIRVFEYEYAGGSSGVLTNEQRYHFAQSQGPCQYLSRSSVPVVGPGMTRGSHVGYRFVVVKHGGAAAPGGRTEHAFTSSASHADYPEMDLPFWPFAPRTSLDYARGFEKEVATWNASDELQKFVEHRRFDANDEYPRDPAVLKRYRALAVKASLMTKDGLPSAVYYRRYEAIAAWLHPVSETVRDYDQFGRRPVTTVREFGYENRTHLQPTRTTETNGDNSQRITTTQYASERYADMAATNQLTSVYATTILAGADVEARSWTTFAQDGGYWRAAATWAWTGDGSPNDPTAPADPGGSETEATSTFVAYDDYGRVTEQQDARGTTTTTGYSGGASGDVFTTRVSRGDHSVSYTYHPLFNQVERIDDNGRVTNYDYDDFGRLESIRNADDELVSAFSYALGLPSAVTTTNYLDAQRSISVVEYTDGLGRPIQRNTENGAQDVVSATEYDRFGRVARAYRPYFRPSIAFDPDYAAHASAVYPEANGRPFVETIYLADPLNRVDRTFGEGESEHAVNYDYLNVPHLGLAYVLSIDESAKRTFAFTDRLGRTVKTVTGSALTDFTFDVLDQRTRVVAPGRQVTTYRYDPLKRLVESTSPDAGTVRRRYDRNGNLRYTQDAEQAPDQPGAEGKVSFVGYDLHNRPTIGGEGSVSDFPQLDPNASASFETVTANWRSRRHYDSRPSASEFPWSLFPAEIGAAPFTNSRGRLAASAQKSGGSWQIVLYAYRPSGAVIEKQVLNEWLPATTTTMRYTPDRQGNPTTIHTQVGAQSFYHFYERDPRGLLARIFTSTTGSKPAAPDVEYTFTASGQTDHLRFRGGTDIPHTYTPRGWLRTIDDLGNPSRSFAAEYTYNRNGTLLSAEFNQTASPAAVKRYKYTFGYDTMNRLTTADYDGATSFDLDYAYYDQNGNLTHLALRDQAGNPIDDLTFAYLAGTNRLTTVTDAVAPSPPGWDAEDASLDYDANGNITRAGPPYNLSSVVYDPRQLPERMVQGQSRETFHYRYNAEGQRYYKQVSSGTRAGGDDLEEYYPLDGAVTLGVFGADGALAHWNIVAGAKVVGRRTANGALYFYLEDNVGSTRATIGADGQVVETNDYYPFGLVMPGRGRGANPPTREGFTGKERDPESGLHYFGARFYMPALGRWMVVDPKEGEYPGVSPYAYVLNNPLTSIDPDGKAVFKVVKVLVKAIIKGGDIASEVAGIVDDASTLLAKDASAGDRAFALVSLASEFLSPVSLKEGKAALKALGVVEKAGDAARKRSVTVLGHHRPPTGDKSYAEAGQELRDQGVDARTFEIDPKEWDKMSPGERTAANIKFLDQAIERGDEIQLSTKFDNARIPSAFAEELKHLWKKGYRPSADGTRMVPSSAM